jgi:hypothetical protein
MDLGRNQSRRSVVEPGERYVFFVARILRVQHNRRQRSMQRDI